MSELTFDQPWRVHWRLLGHDPEPILDRVKECHPLSVILEVNSPDELRNLGLPWPSTSFVVVLRGWSGTRGTLSGDGVVRWEFPVTGPEEARDAAVRFRDRPAPGMGAFRWLPARGQLGDLPLILQIDLKTGFGVTLPNRPVDGITARDGGMVPDPGELSSLDPAQLRKLASELGEDRLRIHDFILSQIMGLGTIEPAGCEAANALSLVDGDGEVYPCDSLRVKLGDLRQESLMTIWDKPIRQRIRRDVSSLPSVCSSCADLASCRGGCRGIVYHLKGHFKAPDPLCERYGVEDDL